MSDSGTARHVGLIVLGDTGVGKTWLVRLLMGHFDDNETIKNGDSVVLETRQSTYSVTQNTEMHEYKSDDKSESAVKVRVYNVPGVDEHKVGNAETEEKREANKLELQKAFDATVNTYIFYVFSAGSGGRITAAAWANYHALQEAYEFSRQSLCFVVNQVQNKGEQTERYKAEQAVAIEEETEISNPRILFVELISETPPEKNKAEKKALLERMKTMLSHMAPVVHTKKHDVVMTADKLKQAEDRYKERDTQLTQAQEAYKQQTAQMEQKTAELQQQVQEGKLSAEQQQQQMETFKKQQQDTQTDLQNKLSQAEERTKQMQQQQQSQRPHGLFGMIGQALDGILGL